MFFKTLFEEFGEIESILVKKSQDDKFFSFVSFKETIAAQKAYDHFNNDSLDPLGSHLN